METLVKKILFISFLVFVLIPLSIVIMIYFTDYRMERVGEDLAEKVEMFRQNNGRLPESRSELGLEDTESSQPFYEKRGEDYVIYYAIGFDESKVYYSNSGKWEDFYQTADRDRDE